MTYYQKLLQLLLLYTRQELIKEIGTSRQSLAAWLNAPDEKPRYKKKRLKIDALYNKHKEEIELAKKRRDEHYGTN